ncbi:hypothetical protein ABZ876_12315 [Streptomyces sp. NPDC046931]|uniref:hypothetical protein n=1 Tax=Streptomyces sp. NPDC046931 TaxID=3154806 RepID=UPI0033FF9BA3
MAPLATDMYVPGCPELGRALHATESAVQLSMTAFLAGLGASSSSGRSTTVSAAARKDLMGLGTVLQVLQHGGSDPAYFVSECAVFFDEEADQ